MSHCILQQALLARNLYNIKHVGLSGGVFQNRVLTDATLELLTANNFDVAIPVNVPINDAGISYGQVIEILI
jgi:hydrogenase maturation protein HypF